LVYKNPKKMIDVIKKKAVATTKLNPVAASNPNVPDGFKGPGEKPPQLVTLTEFFKG
jgi:hypothetical protein